MKGHRVADRTEKLCHRCNGWGHTGDACFTAKEEAVRAATGKGGSRGGEGEDSTVQVTALKVDECFHAISVVAMLSLIHI